MESDSTTDLATPIQFLKGGGPARAELFAKLGVLNVRDLLFFFPRDYQDLTDLRKIEDLEEDRLLSVLGTVEEVDLRGIGPGRSVLGVLVRQEQQHLRALWFNQPYLRDRFQVGQSVLLSGKAKFNATRWEMVHPRVQDVDSEAGAPVLPLVPVYPLTEGLQQRHVKTLTKSALDSSLDLLDEVFPQTYLAAHDLWPIKTALPQLHFPTDKESLERARRRFVYQELFVLQLALALKRQQVLSGERAPALEATSKVDARIRRLLPFELTAGQNAVIAEIAADMARESPMNRLLQGDVGSGKTIVAVYAMLLAVAHGAQAVLMAPTEILARQHVQTFERLLAGSQVRIGLLTGGLTTKARQELIAKAAAGEVDIVVGTTAFVESGLEFPRLGLVVIDEQHKFGVRQRAMLKKSGLQPHYLVMTATPIPRTVGMTMFGDLDVSTLRDRPPGRQQVHTYLPPSVDWPKWWEFFRKKLREGRQGYVITPLVEGSDEVQDASLEESYEALTNGELEAFRLGLVHGRMTSDQKDAAMEAFRRGDTQVLVATSVVEVGVDVPNATLMTIQAAQRFGLAQLHQLRGRVSRGAFAGYCCLFTDADAAATDERLQALVKTTDGFELAELDFALRGPGDLLGTRQHGLPPLRIADLQRDTAILEEARRDAQELVAADPALAQDEHILLRRMVLVRYGKALELGDVG